MIQKLRKKIIISNMLLVGLVLGVVFAALGVSSWRSSSMNVEQGLSRALEFGDAPVQVIGGPRDEPRQGAFTACVVVLTDGDGAIADVRELGASIDADALREAVTAALASDRDSGVLKGLGLCFARRSSRETPEGMKLAFADAVALETDLRQNVFISLGLFAGSIGVLFLISLWLSRFAVKPVDEAWTRQRQFVADASHELKTPLTVILANNSILKAHGEESVTSQSQWVDSTGEEAERMRGLAAADPRPGGRRADEARARAVGPLRADGGGAALLRAGGLRQGRDPAQRRAGRGHGGQRRGHAAADSQDTAG